MSTLQIKEPTYWFAIRAESDVKAAAYLAQECEEVFFPTEKRPLPATSNKRRAVIPHVLFIRTTERRALELERCSKDIPGVTIPFWIYRYPHSSAIQPISEDSIHLLRLLTESGDAPCRIYSPRDYKPGQAVEVIDGPFKGYSGEVHRIAKNRHVVVKIEGVCMVILPFIHPDLLKPL